MTHRKDEIISFKVDPELAEAMKGIENRSEFIRGALLMALDSTCPLCRGSGRLTLRQKRHWLDFARTHRVEECGDCHELHLTCGAKEGPSCDSD